MKKSKFENYPVIETRDLKEMLHNSKRLYKDRIAVLNKDKPGGPYSEITFNKLYDDVNYLGTALKAFGLENVKVAVIGENRYEWVTTYLSTVNGVGTIVPLDKELPKEEIAYLIKRANIEIVIFSSKVEKDVKEILKENEHIKYAIHMDIASDEDDLISYSRLLERGKNLVEQGDTSFESVEIDPDEMRIILFTSGTTGLAKGVMLSHKNIISNIIAVSKFVNTKDGDTFLSVLPAHHTYECTVGILSPIYQGSRVAFCEGLKHIVKNLKESEATHMLGVPLLYNSLYNKIIRKAQKEGTYKKLQKGIKINNALKKVGADKSQKLFKAIHQALGGNLKYVISGAAAIDSDVAQFFNDVGIPLIEGYGLTECSPIVCANLDRMPLSGTVGPALPEIEVKIDNPNNDGIGEIVTKSDCVMLGYYEDEEATKQVITDGWFHTGDLGYLDEMGYLRITGREKNVIVTRNGKNIFPEEVELYLGKSDYIKECLVWGEDDPKQGDTIVHAEILPDLEYMKEMEESYSDKQLQDLFQEIVHGVNAKMSFYKRIKRFNIRDKEFEKTTTQKIKRHVEENKTK